MLSKRTVEMLLKLVESRISYVDTLDRQDLRDLEILQQCREELKESGGNSASNEDLMRRAQIARRVH